MSPPINRNPYCPKRIQ